MINFNRFARSIVLVILLFSLALVFVACDFPFVKNNKKEDSSSEKLIYSYDLIIHGETIAGYGNDENIVIKDKYYGETITTIDVSLDYSNGGGRAKTLTIPHTVSNITEKSLNRLVNLESIIVDSNNKYYKSVDGVLYSKDGAILIHYPAKKQGERFVIPEGVQHIAYRAFACNEYLKEIIIPETVTKICELAFASLPSMTEISIPDSVVTIEQSAFASNKSLVNIEFGQNVRTIGDGAFSKCTALESIVLPDSLKNIGSQLFVNCSSLKEVTLPAGITSIPEEMFAGCSSLKNFTVPDSVRTIGTWAFHASGIENIVFSTGVQRIGSWSFEDCHSLKSITLPENIKFVGSSFKDCINLESVTCLGGGISFSANAFYNCPKLKEVHVQSNADWASMKFSHADANPFLNGASLYIDGVLVTKFEFPSDTKLINSFLFAGYELLESVIVPEGVEKIDMGAFSGCSNIKEITLPSTITQIDGSAFSKCTSLKTLYLPSVEWWLKLKQHYSDLFINAENVYINGEKITEVVIPEGTSRIESFAFYGCEFITTIYIPKSMTYMSTNSIALCGELDIYYDGTMEEWEELDDDSHYWCDDYRDHYTIHCIDGDITT